MRASGAGPDRREGRRKYHSVRISCMWCKCYSWNLSPKDKSRYFKSSHLQVRTVEPLRRRVSSLAARARGPRGVQGDDHARQLHPPQDASRERQVALLRLPLLLLHPRMLNVARHMPLQEGKLEPKYNVVNVVTF